MFELRYPVMEEADAGSPTSGGDAAPNPSAGDSTPPPAEPSLDWRSSLPPELANSPSLKDIPDVATLAKNYENTKAMVGNSIRLPTGEAGQEAIDAVVAKVLENGNIPLMRKPDPESPEAMAELYKALGRPEEASGYQAPEEINPELFGSLSKTALELGLSKQQYEGMAAALGQQQSAEFEKYETERSQGVNQLRGEWGPAFDQKLGRAVQIAEALKAPQALVEALKSGAANAEAIRFMDTVATQLGKEGSQLASQIGQVTEATVADLQQRIAERTQRILNENMTPQEKDRLIQANIKDHQDIAANR